MKQYSKTHLRDCIIYKGETYKVNIEISGAMRDNNTPVNTIAATLRKEGRKAVLVNVLSRSVEVQELGPPSAILLYETIERESASTLLG